jgi:hypothetical protein
MSAEFIIMAERRRAQTELAKRLEVGVASRKIPLHLSCSAIPHFSVIIPFMGGIDGGEYGM